MRKSIPLVVLAASALLLSGCTAAGNSAAANCKGVASGSVSNSVKVTGKLGTAPKVSFKEPLAAKTTQRTFITTGSGAVATKSTTVDVALVAYNGTTGKELTTNGYGTSAKIPITVGDATLIPVLSQVVNCAPIGSRVVAASPVKTAFGSADPSSLGLKSTDTIVFVADIVDMMPAKANGADQKPQAGFPTVKLAASGKPTVTIPKTTAPTETKVEVLKKGSGETVKAGDTVTVQYQGTIWRNSKVFDQSWGRAPATFSTTGVIKGFATGLVGQTVGSQTVIVIPPADGYGAAGQPSAGIEGTDTLVFVVDILKTTR
ncbi:MAG TPA: FKBP-type peptidyl-prolyl cis-trans isomerase [Microbacteriaceae bacterium]